MILHSAFIGSLLFAGYVDALAQQRLIDRRGADTLRYHEVNHSELGVNTPSGARIMDQKQEATIGMAFHAADSTTAWFDQLALEVESTQGAQLPNTTPLLRQPFLLSVDDRGRVRTIRAPAVSAEIRVLTDLSQEFADFFVRLPAQPLALGLEWTDTLANEMGQVAQSYRKYTVITKWRVEKDSLFQGAPVWLLTSSGELTLETGDPVADRHSQAVSTLGGHERGRAIFSRDGRFISRTKEGRLEGNLAIRGAGSARSFSQDYTYESRVERLP